MNSVATEWLELAKALGPYAVAIIAIAGSFLSAALAQRNWQRQFGAQQSVVLLNKRLELAEGLPSKLFEAVQHGTALLLNARLSETLNMLNSEGRNFSQETISGFLKKLDEEAQAFHAAMRESLKLFFLSVPFFNDEIKREAAECLSAMKRLNQSQEDAATFRNDLKQSVPPSATVEQVLVELSNAANGHLLPISNDMSARIGKLACLMVEYANPNT
jgi:hypothetical protein